MDWTTELIGLELERYVTSERRVESNLQKARNYWQMQLDKGRITEREADVVNDLLQSVSMYQNDTKRLLEAVGWMYNTLNINPAEIQRLRNRILELEISLEKYKVCHDPTLHPYIKLADFR